MTCQVANARTSRRCSGDVQGFQQAGEPLLGAGEFLVAGREDAAGGEHLPEEPGGAGPRVLVERLVGGGGPAGRDIGEDGGAGALAQPVQRGARVAGRADRLEHGAHRRGDVPVPARQEHRGAPAQAAPGAQSLVVELVLGAAAGAGGHDGQPGAVRAGNGVRPWREDQAPFLAAARAAGPAAQRGRVAGVADRAFGPSCRRRPVLPAAGARRGRLRRARRAERAAAGGEVAGTVPAAAAADGGGQPVAVDADVRRAVTRPDRDRGLPPAVPACRGDPGNAGGTARRSARRRRHGRRSP